MPVVLYLPAPLPTKVLFFPFVVDLISNAFPPAEFIRAHVGLYVPVICLIERIIFLLNVVLGLIDNVPVEEAFGPQALVAEYAMLVSPPNEIVNVPAVLPVTVKEI